MGKGTHALLAALAAALLAGCGTKLDQAAARAALEEWARGNVIKAVGPKESMNPPACLESLVAAGYVKPSGPNSLFYVSTGKLAPVRTDKEHPEIALLPLLKTEILDVSPPVQIPGEKTAEVRFTFKQSPAQPGVHPSCARGGGVVQNASSAFDLTDKGWEIRVNKGAH